MRITSSPLIRTIAVTLILTLTACTSTGSQIGTSMSLCCPGDYASYDSYGLESKDMPLFLRDYVIEEFDAVFQQKGLEREDHVNDIRIVLSYNHINLNPEQEGIDPFVRVESFTTQLSYIAELKVEIFETRSNDLVWAGSVSRIHQVGPGEYMHEDRARPSFQSAFQRLLSNYPDN